MEMFGILIGVTGIILIWRGIWVLLDRYFLPDNPLLSCILCIAIGIVLIWFDDNKLDELK